MGWSNLILEPTLALIRAQLGFRIQVRAECGKKLGYHPYKLVYKYYKVTKLNIFINVLLRNKLKEADFPKRLSMCQLILTKADADPAWLSNLWTSDEANFNLNGKINQINFSLLSK